jgi:hypothetical protein
MRQRGGPGGLGLWANVKQKTLEPFSNAPRGPGRRVSTEAASRYSRLQSWGYNPQRGTPGRGEGARDDDGDGWGDVQGQTMEGGWSLWRRWLRPQRGIAQEKRRVSLGCFALVPNVRTRGKALLPALLELRVT